MNTSEIVIFKLLSGEMVIGDLRSPSRQAPDGRDRALTELETFEVENPVSPMLAQNGVMLVPFLPWVGMKRTASMRFYGKHVMSEVTDLEPHAQIIDDYKRMYSPIALAGSNVRSFMPT